MMNVTLSPLAEILTAGYIRYIVGMNDIFNTYTTNPASFTRNEYCVGYHGTLPKGNDSSAITSRLMAAPI